MLEVDIADFVAKWVDAWNRHDLVAVLSQFDEEVVFTSPLASRIIPECGGVVHGKAALSKYWKAALDQNPVLQFQVTSTFVGVDSILIGFRNELDQDRIEVLRFRDGLVVEGHGTYPA